MATIRARLVFNHLPRLQGELRAKVSQAVEASAIAIEQDVKGGGPHAAPYRTGNLRRSYLHRRESDLLYVVENDPQIAPYAPFVELGTRRMAPRPHLGPAAEAELPRFVDRVRDALRGMR